MNNSKYTDIVVVYKNLNTSKIHQFKESYKLVEKQDNDRFIKSLVDYEHPNVKNKIVILKILVYDFFGSKVKESISRSEFYTIKGYSDMLKDMQIKWTRDSKIKEIMK